MLQKLWVIKNPRVKRDHYGAAVVGYTVCCQRGELCLVDREVSFNGQRASLERLPARALLVLMVRRPGIAVGQLELVNYLYGCEPYGDSIAVHLTKVRAALRELGAPEILNRHGQGWLLP